MAIKMIKKCKSMLRKNVPIKQKVKIEWNTYYWTNKRTLSKLVNTQWHYC